jgi:hypothetical protein
MYIPVRPTMADAGEAIMQRIYSVEGVHLYSLPIAAAMIGIVASGRAQSSGWTNPQLGAWFYVTPPADGIQDFDLLAEEPTGLVLPVLSPLSASLIVAREWRHYWGPERPLRGVRVHAQTGAREAFFEEGVAVHANRLTDVAQEGGDLSLAAPVASLIGTTLRVYRTGEVLTDEYLPDRTNIELDPTTRRIVRVRAG